MQLEAVCSCKSITHFDKNPVRASLTHYHSYSLSAALKLSKSLRYFLSGPFFVEVHLHGVGSTLMEDFGCFLVGCSVNCTKFDTRSCMCAKSRNNHPSLKSNLDTNNGQNYLKLYRYQCMPGKVT